MSRIYSLHVILEALLERHSTFHQSALPLACISFIRTSRTSRNTNLCIGKDTQSSVSLPPSALSRSPLTDPPCGRCRCPACRPPAAVAARGCAEVGQPPPSLLSSPSLSPLLSLCPVTKVAPLLLRFGRRWPPVAGSARSFTGSVPPLAGSGEARRPSVRPDWGRRSSRSRGPGTFRATVRCCSRASRGGRVLVPPPPLPRRPEGI